MGRVGAGAGVQGIGIGEKGYRAGLLDHFHHFSDVHRAYERRIAHLSEMDFHRRQIPFVEDCGYAGSFHEPSDFSDKIFLDRGTHIDEIDLAGHGILHSYP